MTPASRLAAGAALLAAFLAAAARPLAAQSERDVAAYFALFFTRAGAAPPAVLGPAVAGARSSVDLTYGQVSFGRDASFHNYFATFGTSAGGSRMGVSLGTITCDGCKADLALGLEWEIPVRTGGTERQRWALGLLPQVGYFLPFESGNDARTVSAALSAPVSIRVTGDAGLALTAFLAPGYGWGYIGDNGDSLNGFRPIVGGGVRLDGLAGIGIYAGLQRVVLEGTRDNIGAGVSIPFGDGAR